MLYEVGKRMHRSGILHLRSEYVRRDERRRHIGRHRQAGFSEAQPPGHASPPVVPRGLSLD